MGIVKIDTIDHADGNWRKIAIALNDQQSKRANAC
jgi:hypothetical protein